MEPAEIEALLDTLAAWEWMHDERRWQNHGDVFETHIGHCLLDDKTLDVVREAMSA